MHEIDELTSFSRGCIQDLLFDMEDLLWKMRLI